MFRSLGLLYRSLWPHHEYSIHPLRLESAQYLIVFPFQLWLTMDTSSLTVEQRKLLAVFSELPFEAAALIDGEEKNPNEVR